jgi:hypothetical protein
MKQWIYIFCGVSVLFLLSACAGPGPRIPISFSYTGEVSSTSKIAPSQQKVVVFPLEDKRDDTKLIGRHIHLFKQVDTYEPTMPLGENIAQLLIFSLRQRGWDARLASPGIRPQDITTDLVVTGTIQTLWADAVSRVGYTKIDARFGVTMEILDPKTGTKITSKVANQNNPKVVVFNPESLQEILNELVSSGLNRIDLTSSQAP